MTQMEIVVDELSFNEESDGYIIAETAYLMTYFQLFDNVPEDQVQFDVTLKDEASRIVFETMP